MPPLGQLRLICALVQIVGFLALVLTQASIPAVNALIGFAAIVTFFIVRDERVRLCRNSIGQRYRASPRKSERSANPF